MLTAAAQSYLGTLAGAFAVCLTIAFAVIQPQPGNSPDTRKTSIGGVVLLSFVILLDLAVVAVPLWVLGYQAMGHAQRAYWVLWCGFGGLGVVVLNVIYFVVFAFGRSGLARSKMTDTLTMRAAADGLHYPDDYHRDFQHDPNEVTDGPRVAG